MERGEVTLLLREKPPLMIYTWIWMTDENSLRSVTIEVLLQPYGAQCYRRCLICRGKSLLVSEEESGDKMAALHD